MRHTFAAVLLALPLAAFAQTSSTSAPAGRQVRQPGLVALSPDGTSLAYTIKGKEGTELHLLPFPTVDMSKEKIVAPGDQTSCSNTTPMWSPDSKTLAYLSTCTGKDAKSTQQQIFLYTPADGKSRQLTHVTGNMDTPAWSPDGKQIAFLFVENATRHAGALDAMKPFAGVIGEDNIEIQGVYAVKTEDGNGAWLLPPTPEMYTYEFAWAPDSKTIATTGTKAPGENNWWVAKLWRVNDRHAQLILDPSKVSGAMHGLQIAVPKFSPDGKKIAFIGGLMSDFGSTGGDLWLIDARPGAQPVDVTPDLDGTVVHESFVSPTHVGFVEDKRGHTLMLDWDVEKKAAVPNSTVDLGLASLSGGLVKDAPSFSPANGGYTVWVQSGLEQAPEIWGAGSGAPKQFTHFNEGLKLRRKTISVEWVSDGAHVQGWLTFPKDFDEHKKYGIITQVHGGPSASIGARWDMGPQQLTNYFIFQPNPRGSFGQGEAFTQANRKDFGYGDLRDILTGLDKLEQDIPSIDKNREGVTGWSYGGYMTMFSVTQTPRFKAAVAGAGIANWQSYYGQNQISEWMVPFFGASVYDDPAVYAKSSPITFIKNVTTPTLVIVGDRDGECPAPQSFEFWSALKAHGVKTQLVIYPNEGHGFRDPAHIKDRAERTQKWFDENLK
ncbi:S9 family peptidase [Granulicella cerasi]|uniref:S9 family peptidase n=1 Tax=Granulicella cerasi TaxID=741063 RepID=UPI0021DFC8E1|nr:S9 family peptidase [Granulicella cerasi]